MRLASAVLLTALTAPAFAQEPQVIALNAEDAEACKQGKCVQIAPAALKALMERVQRGDEYEAAAHELARQIVAERKNRCA